MRNQSTARETHPDAHLLTGTRRQHQRTREAIQSASTPESGFGLSRCWTTAAPSLSFPTRPPAAHHLLRLSWTNSPSLMTQPTRLTMHHIDDRTAPSLRLGFRN